MVSVFPKSFVNQAVSIYIVALAVSTLLFAKYSMDFKFFLFGIIEVVLFFQGTNSLTKKWSNLSNKEFERRLFCWAFLIRFIWVIFSYFFFIIYTGQPFEFEAADAIAYHEDAKWLAVCDWDVILMYLFIGRDYVSDSGYILYLTCFYRFFGINIFLVRVVKCILSSILCVLMFRMATRNFCLATGRMTGLFCMLMPNLIWYCGLHLKETEMLFLAVLCIELADYALHKIGKNKLCSFIVSGFLALLLFGFRTVLGVVVFLAISCALVMSSTKTLSLWKKWLFGSLLTMGLLFAVGQQIQSEINELIDESGTNQEKSLEWRAERGGGNAFAVYAGKAVFAPLIFTIPFPTIVDINLQQNQQILGGGNYVKNITSFFTILAIFMLFLSGDWRKYVLPLAFLCGYLVVIALSAFAQSERFHLPVLPFSLMFAAYGITHINKLGIKLFRYWTFLIFVAIIGWSWFKLAGRGLI